MSLTLLWKRRLSKYSLTPSKRFQWLGSNSCITQKSEISINVIQRGVAEIFMITNKKSWTAGRASGLHSTLYYVFASIAQNYGTNYSFCKNLAEIAVNGYANVQERKSTQELDNNHSSLPSLLIGYCSALWECQKITRNLACSYSLALPARNDAPTKDVSISFRMVLSKGVPPW